jgi:hypothetical protein
MLAAYFDQREHAAISGRVLMGQTDEFTLARPNIEPFFGKNVTLAYPAQPTCLREQCERRNVPEKLLYLQAKHLTDFTAPRVQSAADRFALVMFPFGR